MQTIREIINKELQKQVEKTMKGKYNPGNLATGRLKDSIQAVDLGIEALDYWRYIDEGRPPGGMPPVGSIQEWIEAKGLDLNPWAVAFKIRDFGTIKYRLWPSVWFGNNIKFTILATILAIQNHPSMSNYKITYKIH